VGAVVTEVKLAMVSQPLPLGALSTHGPISDSAFPGAAPMPSLTLL
jgi:hypothetical protein